MIGSYRGTIFIEWPPPAIYSEDDPLSIDFTFSGVYSDPRDPGIWRNQITLPSYQPSRLEPFPLSDVRDKYYIPLDGHLTLPHSLFFTLFAIPAIILWRHSRRRGPNDCRKCGYNLTGNTSGRCPECGTPTPATNATNLTSADL